LSPDRLLSKTLNEKYAETLRDILAEIGGPEHVLEFLEPGAARASRAVPTISPDGVT
jgi:hypothetical protein